MDFRGDPWKRTLVSLISAVAAALLCLFLASSALAATDDDDDDGGGFVPRQIVVALKPGTGGIDHINRAYQTTTRERLAGELIYLLNTRPGVDPSRLSAEIAREQPARVLYAEPNFRAGTPEGSGRFRARPGGTPEPSIDRAPYRSQYAMDRLNLPEAQAVNRGAGSVVAVIDTGVQSNHRELASRMLAGYDFVNNDRNPADVGNNLDEDRDGVKDEMVGHGTHVAGIVALAAPEARIVPVRALDTEGRGTTFGIAKAIKYAVVTRRADVVNLSLGTSRQTDLLEDLIGDDDDDGNAIFVAAAGNDGNAVPQYPAAEEDAIAVTSVNGAEKKSGFANYGAWVTVAAPGDRIYAPFPAGRYATWSGTSMATPFVAGQAALIRSIRPTADAGCVTNIIDSTDRPLTTTDPTYGSRVGGHADVAASTRYARDTGCPPQPGD